jgi:hypothetical protein
MFLNGTQLITPENAHLSHNGEEKFWLLIYAFILIVTVWSDVKRVAYKNFNGKLIVPVNTFLDLYYWTIQYHCLTRCCFQAQLPVAEKLLDWCYSRKKQNVEGILVPDIVIKTYSRACAFLLGVSSCITTSVLVLALGRVKQGLIAVNDKTTIEIIYVFLLCLLVALLCLRAGMALYLECAAVQWVITTALHALSPVELAFGVATGIRLHTYQQAINGRGPDAGEEWGDMSGSGQGDGMALYTCYFIEFANPCEGMASLYPGDTPLKVFSTALTSLLTFIAVTKATQNSPSTNTTALLGVAALILGAAALLMQMVMNLRKAALKMRKGAKQAYAAAALAYWSPRLTTLGPFGKDHLWAELVDEMKRRNSSSQSSILTDKEWCKLTMRELDFHSFAEAYFPKWYEVLKPVQLLNFRMKGAAQGTAKIFIYSYSPSDTLTFIMDQIKLLRETSTRRIEEIQREVNGSNLNELLIYGVPCGVRKLEISKDGCFRHEPSLKQMADVVEKDLLQLASDVQTKSGISVDYSLKWWFAQPTFDQFIGAISRYRTLCGEHSYAPGIKAVLDNSPEERDRLQSIRWEPGRVDPEPLKGPGGAGLLPWLRDLLEGLIELGETPFRRLTCRSPSAKGCCTLDAVQFLHL